MLLICTHFVSCWLLPQGKKRTKLGLREFITLGEFEQQIDIQQQKAASL
jgi:hypothetical protein